MRGASRTEAVWSWTKETFYEAKPYNVQGLYVALIAFVLTFPLIFIPAFIIAVFN